MISKPKRNELIIYYVLANPISAREILFNDLANLSEWDKNKFAKVRKYQYQMASFDGLFLFDKTKTDRENFELKRGLAESFNLGGRLTGKSLIGIKTDSVLAVLLKTFKRGVIDSFDKLHLNGIIKDIINIFEFHPFLKHFKRNIISSPDYNLQFKNGTNILSVNNKIEGKSKGDQWCQKHVDIDWAEEASYLTVEVTNKKLMAKSELGMIQRLTGMTDFTDLSPVGKLFNDLSNKNKIVNMPSYVNPNYSDKDEEDAIREFDGRDSSGYAVQILGKIMKGSACPYDIDRIRLCYKDKLILKNFEIKKENFYNYKDILILEKLSNAEKVGIYMDIGEGSAPTEIIIVQKIKDKLRWTHNITVNKITPDELYELVRFIIIQTETNIIGFDNTSGVGKALGSNLAKDFPENLIPVDFNAKIPVDYEKDEKGIYIIDTKGNYSYKEERVDDWSVQRIKHLFYNQLIELPEDYKFDKQIQNTIIIRTGIRIKYDCKVANHLYQSIPKDEIVVCKLDNSLVVDTIENISKESIGKNIFVPSYNKGKIVWNKGKIIEEQNKNNKIYEFICYPGARVKVTEGHSMLVWDRDKMILNEKLAKEVTKDDMLLSIDKKVFNSFNNKCQNLKYFTFKNDGYNNNKKIFNSIKVDEKMAYLLGMYCAEGSLMGRKQGVTLYVGTDELLAKKVLNIAISIFKNSGRIYNKPIGYNNGKIKTKTFSVVYYGQGIAEFFSYLCGRGAKNKRIPQVIFNSPKKVIKSFLKGLKDGDGNIKTGRIVSISRILANGVNVLNSMLNYYTEFSVHKNKNNNNEYSFGEAVRNGYWRNIPLDAFPIKYSKTIGKTLNRKKLKNANYDGVSCHWNRFKKNQEIIPLVEDVNFIKIKNIEITEYEGKVYDLSVENNHNFAAGVGNIIVHNSFQVMAIAEWQTEFLNLKPAKRRKPGIGSFGSA